MIDHSPMDFAVPYFFQMELMVSYQGQLLCVNVVGRGVLAPVELSENSTFLGGTTGTTVCRCSF